MTQAFEKLEKFDDVDGSGEQAKFLAFLDRIDRIPDVSVRRAGSYALLGLRPGARVAEIGCGIGTACIEMAAQAAPDGRVLGFDLSEAMVAEARRRATAAGSRASFEVGSATELPLGDASVDAYRAERVYQHIADLAGALGEALRVLRPGGRIVLVDQDWDCAFLDADDLATSRQVHRAFSDSLVRGTIGRQYHRALRAAGFADVRVEAQTVTSTSADEYGFVVDIIASAARAAGVDGRRLEAWTQDQRRRMASGDFFMAMTHFIASARRPNA